MGDPGCVNLEVMTTLNKLIKLDFIATISDMVVMDHTETLIANAIIYDISLFCIGKNCELLNFVLS